MIKVNLITYNKNNFHPGKNILVIILWNLISILLVRNPAILSSSFKVMILKLFGAKIGKGVIIKQGVNIKYPWKLNIGDYSWVGENVWIDNLVSVDIGSNVCISQGALLLTGNHNYKLRTFDLILGPIVIEEGVWIGARAVVCPGITCKSHAVLTVGSVANTDLEERMIYQGNPATSKKERVVTD